MTSVLIIAELSKAEQEFLYKILPWLRFDLQTSPWQSSMLITTLLSAPLQCTEPQNSEEMLSNSFSYVITKWLKDSCPSKGRRKVSNSFKVHNIMAIIKTQHLIVSIASRSIYAPFWNWKLSVDTDKMICSTVYFLRPTAYLVAATTLWVTVPLHCTMPH